MKRSGLRKVVVTGGTGLVGRRLVEVLASQGALVAVVTRNPERLQGPKGAVAHPWRDLPALLEGADAVFNLAGEGIADARWSPARKEAILLSRTESTRRVVEALRWVSRKPGVLVNASAIGFYGAHGQAPLDETSEAGQGFLPEVCQAWEREAEGVTAMGIRLVKLRLGVVLAREGGALPKLVRPVKLFLGCTLGSGHQGFSWIHIEDLIRLLLEAARNPNYEGAVNATAPCPISQRAFTTALARQLHRPVWPLPALLTRLASGWALGEMAGPMLLQGAYVHPSQALRLGFTFTFEQAEAALLDLLQPFPGR
jgi:uncharacterized protein (TIGR01777 family)